MSYKLAISHEAADDLRAIIDDLPSARRGDALDAVDAALQKLAANPLLAQRQYLDRPTYLFHFVADDVHYHWGCTFKYSQDESAIEITQIFRPDL